MASPPPAREVRWRREGLQAVIRMGAAPVVHSAASALVVGGVALAVGRRAAHAEDPDFDLDDSMPNPLNLS